MASLPGFELAKLALPDVDDCPFVLKLLAKAPLVVEGEDDPNALPELLPAPKLKDGAAAAAGLPNEKEAFG